MPNAAAMAIRPFALPLLPAAASACANAAGASNITVVIAVNNIPSFLIICTASLCFYNCRQEVVPGHRAAGLTLEQQTCAAKNLFVLVGGRQTEIHRRQ